MNDKKTWDSFFLSKDRVSDDFMKERTTQNKPGSEEKEWLQGLDESNKEEWASEEDEKAYTDLGKDK